MDEYFGMITIWYLVVQGNNIYISDVENKSQKAGRARIPAKQGFNRQALKVLSRWHYWPNQLYSRKYQGY